jgi:hypothetical protein
MHNWIDAQLDYYYRLEKFTNSYRNWWMWEDDIDRKLKEEDELIEKVDELWEVFNTMVLEQAEKAESLFNVPNTNN